MDYSILGHPTLLSALATCVVAALVQLFRKRASKSKSSTLDAEHVFVFKNKELVDASPSARDALNVEDLDEDVFNQMLDRLSDVFPSIVDRFERQSNERLDFELTEVSSEGPMRLRVQFDGAHTTLAIQGIAAPLSRKLILDRDQVIAADAELKTLRGTVETAPFPMWRETAQGTIDWVNRAYLDVLDGSELTDGRGAWPPPRLFESGTVAKPGDAALPHRKSLKSLDGTVDWYEITAFGVGENSLHFAVNANATARAEESQRNFLQTLTQTFSYLPTGLAIFDRARKLVLFNPALTDLTGLEPTWLSLRPTLYDFLNILREKRMLPERKDFTDWRGKINALEQSASDGTYCESWTLPTGQTYRVTGRPHPEGAIAFLFEDISAEISLTRKFRLELELTQSIFDNLPEAIAVFGNDGMIATSNAAYAELWGVDPRTALAQMTIVDAVRTWQATSRPTPLWGDVRDFISSSRDRIEWIGQARMKDDRILECRFSPLSGGATLVAFRVGEALRGNGQDKAIRMTANPINQIKVQA